MLERNSYLIFKYSLNLQNLSLICMYLTPGLTEFILIRIHSLPTITGYNWYNALRYSSAARFHHHPAFTLSQKKYTVLTLIRWTRPALHFRLSELNLASLAC